MYWQEHGIYHPLAEWLGESGVQSFDLDSVGSIPAIPNARYVPSLLSHEQFNEASLPGIYQVYTIYGASRWLGCN